MNNGEKLETNIPTPEQQQLPKNPEGGFEINDEQKFEKHRDKTLGDVESRGSQIKEDGVARLDRTSHSYDLPEEDITAIREENQVDEKLKSNSEEIDQLTHSTTDQIKSIVDTPQPEQTPETQEVNIVQEPDQHSEEKSESGQIQSSEISENDSPITTEKTTSVESAEIKESHNPLPEETPEEFTARFQTLLTNEYIKNNPDIQNRNPLIIKAYYENYMRQALNNFNNSDQMRSEFIDTLYRLQKNENVRQSPEKDEKTLKMIENMIQASSKDSATGEVAEKVEYYANTNQTREFLEKGRKRDSHSYAHMMFGLPEEFVNTTQGLELLHEKVDDKAIFLFGGGESVHDLLTSEEFKPKSVINFDPYLKSESIDKNVNNIYRSENISAADPLISQKIEQGEISKADEIWMTYSVPFYLDNSAEIKDLINNITSSLNEDGNTRMSPIMLQNTETSGENFETRKQALLDSLRDLTNSEDYNITVFDDTIKIHKIKKAPVEVIDSSNTTK